MFAVMRAEIGSAHRGFGSESEVSRTAGNGKDTADASEGEWGLLIIEQKLIFDLCPGGASPQGYRPSMSRR